MRRLLVGLVVAASLAGYTDRPAARAPDQPDPPATTGAPATAASGVPAACTARGTPALVRRFFRALGAGRVDQLDPFFAPAGRFQWYSNSVPPGRRLDDATDRASLLGYLRHRQARHERIAVVAVDDIGYRDSDRTAHFAMLLRRRADDLPGGPQPLGGNGAVDCDSGRLMVVGIGLPP